ncbi:MAG TPA: carbohydrate kinase family protein, partial [Anaerolineales bacterium]|nr:carbohydrate kinase family protein [Anaerolineales bacterium]
MPQVVVLGDINIDVILPVSAYPQTGGEIVSQGGLTSLGGSAANTAVVLAKLGLATRLLGRVGQDAWGEIALGELRVAGVELDHVQRDAQAPTGM